MHACFIKADKLACLNLAQRLSSKRSDGRESSAPAMNWGEWFEDPLCFHLSIFPPIARAWKIMSDQGNDLSDHSIIRNPYQLGWEGAY